MPKSARGNVHHLEYPTAEAAQGALAEVCLFVGRMQAFDEIVGPCKPDGTMWEYIYNVG